MAVFTNQRIHQIFTNIQSEIVSQGELAKRFAVSTRTICSDINELNEYLQDYDACIVYERGNGYHLKINNEALFATIKTEKIADDENIPRTARDRVDALLLKLLILPLPVKSDDIAEKWFISRGTISRT
ncbi:HTH domain-containing protein [Arsenophonus sp. PmNCSU2021_1]|uniref:HTH domain-containing protein n=1 Tax=Arsenophonus sp. PmNCSU2021_1 TaxID=3118989 RepID=UPI002FF41DC1